MLERSGRVMDKSLQSQLRKKYPSLLRFPERTPIAERGIEVLDGWYDLVDEMLERIQSHASTTRAAGKRPPAITQIKEKLGAIRVYLDHSGAVIRAILDNAETRSLSTCESCGKPGKLIASHGWIRVRCYACRNRRPG